MDGVTEKHWQSRRPGLCENGGCHGRWWAANQRAAGQQAWEFARANQQVQGVEEENLCALVTPEPTHVSDPSWLVQHSCLPMLGAWGWSWPHWLQTLFQGTINSKWRCDLSTQTVSPVTFSVTPAFSGFVNMICVYSVNTCSHIHSQVMSRLSIVTGGTRKAKTTEPHVYSEPAFQVLGCGSPSQVHFLSSQQDTDGFVLFCFLINVCMYVFIYLGCIGSSLLSAGFL